MGNALSGDPAGMDEPPSMESLPNIELIDPPVLPEGYNGELEVHLSREAAPDQPLKLVCLKNDNVVYQMNSSSGMGRVFRIRFQEQSACVLQIRLMSMTGNVLGPKSFLLVLPPSVAREANQLFQQFANESIANEHTQQQDGTEAYIPEQRKKLAWTENFRKFSGDLGRLLIKLQTNLVPSPGVLASCLQQDLDRQIKSLAQNKLWEICAFLLQRCTRAGVPIRLGQVFWQEDDISPESIQTLAASV